MYIKQKYDRFQHLWMIQNISIIPNTVTNNGIRPENGVLSLIFPIKLNKSIMKAIVKTNKYITLYI